MRSLMSVTITLCVGLLLSLLVESTPPPPAPSPSRRPPPSLVLGKTRPDDTIQGLAIKGAQPIAIFRQAIDRLLAEK